MSACTAGQRDYCAAQQSVGALLPSGNRSRQFMVIRNCLVFDLIGTTTLFTVGIGDADAAQKWSNAYLLPVMTPDDKGMAKAEVQTALVQATFALRKLDDRPHERTGKARGTRSSQVGSRRCEAVISV